MFIIYIEPLLRWIRAGGRGYTLSPTLSSAAAPNEATQTALVLADDLSNITTCLSDAVIQHDKVLKYCAWAGLTPNADKGAITGAYYSRTGLSEPDRNRILKQELTFGQ
jgi:hypothetical protein